MSIFFKNITFLRLDKWEITAEQLEGILAQHPLQPCQGDQRQTFGWVKPHAAAVSLVAQSQGQMLIALGTEKRLLPSSVINEYTKVRAAEIEEQQGFKVGRKQIKEIKEQVEHELLSRAFTTRGQTQIWIDPKRGFLVVNGGDNALDEALQALHKLFGTDALLAARVRTESAPSAAMTDWLSSGDSPSGFTVDQDCELQNSGEGKATVRYVHHDLGVDEIPKHIASGKKATKLAMTWDDKISFVLTDTMNIKRIAFLGIAKESLASSEDFESEFFIMTSELSELIKATLVALGGAVAEG